GDELAEEFVAAREDIRPLHAHADELVDVEEAAIVHAGCCLAPVGQPIMLTRQKPAQGRGLPAAPRREDGARFAIVLAANGKAMIEIPQCEALALEFEAELQLAA